MTHSLGKQSPESSYPAPPSGRVEPFGLLWLASPWGRGSSPAVHGDGVVAGLLLLLLHGCDEVDHAFALSWDSNLRPAMEMELSHHADLLFLAG